MRPISSHFDRTSLYGFPGNFSCGTQRVDPSKIAPSCPLGPIRAEDLIHLAYSGSSLLNSGHRPYHISIHSVTGQGHDFMLDCDIFLFLVVRSMDKAIDKVKSMTRPKDEL